MTKKESIINIAMATLGITVGILRIYATRRDIDTYTRMLVSGVKALTEKHDESTAN